jgi:3-isopropylmalate dehydrogenase
MTNKPHLVLGALNGDDIGHEIVPASVEVASAAAMLHGLSIDWRPMPVGRRALDTHGSTLPEGTLETLQKMDGFVLGPIGHRDYPKGPGAINPHPIMRKHFNLFANVRPTRSYPDIGCLYDNVDLIIVRENNEGFQPDRNMLLGTGEFRPTDDITLSVRVITRVASERVARVALELARSRRKLVTVVHKNTVFKLGCGMFVEECHKAAKDYPDVTVNEVIVDTMAMRLVRDPHNFDVVVTTNMFGDILSDEAAGLVGGLGMAPGPVHRRRRLRDGAGHARLGPRHRGQRPRQPLRHDRVDAHAARLAGPAQKHPAGGGRGEVHAGGHGRRAGRRGRAHRRHTRQRQHGVRSPPPSSRR